MLIGGFNEDEIADLAALTQQYPVDVRFIELMPMQEKDEFAEEAFIPSSRVLEVLPMLDALQYLVGRLKNECVTETEIFS